MKTTSTSSSRRSELSKRSRVEFTVRVCPSCGSRAIKEVNADWSGVFQSTPYTVPDLRYFACPNCSERVYPPESMRRIEAASPAYSQRRSRKAPKERGGV